MELSNLCTLLNGFQSIDRNSIINFNSSEKLCTVIVDVYEVDFPKFLKIVGSNKVTFQLQDGTYTVDSSDFYRCHVSIYLD